MNISRRRFLGTSAAVFSAELFAGPRDSKAPNPALEKLADVALREAKKLKASYCDIRINRYRDQSVLVRLTPERGTGKTLEVPGISDTDSFGFGVRVIANGAWGFASSPVVTPAEILRITGEAVTIAKANASIKSQPVSWRQRKHIAIAGVRRTRRNPFDVPIRRSSLSCLRSLPR